jgi:hypothetical protein
MFREALFAELAANSGVAALVEGAAGFYRIHWQQVPQKIPAGAAQMPALVYEVSGVQRTVRYCGTDRRVRTAVTIDCYAVREADSWALADAVRGALQDFRGMLGGTVDVSWAGCESELDGQDVEPGLYRVTQSWVFWNLEA